MKHVLVTILSEEDVAAIPNVVEDLKSKPPLSLVVMNNPSIGVNSAKVSEEIDKQISDLEAAEKAASARRDYPAAHQFVQKIEDAKMKRQDILRHGWEKVPPQQRDAMYDKLIAPFLFNPDVRVEILPFTEDITYDLLNTTLGNMGPKWPASLPKDRWSLVTPLSVEPKSVSPQPVASSEPQKRVQTAPKASKPAVEPPSDPREARRLALKPHFTLMKAAKDHGFDIAEYKGRSPELVELILNKEFPAAA